jgi:hypothetical protein
MTVDVAAFGWHATIFPGGWVWLLAGVAGAVVVAVIVKFCCGAARISS